MEIVLSITAIVTSAIFLIIFISLLKEIKASRFNKKETPLIILGLTYLIFTIILILYLANFFIIKTSDILSILAIILAIQTACILNLLYEIKKDKKIFYNLIPFIFLIPLVFFNPKLIHLLIPISLLASLAMFLSSFSMDDETTNFFLIYVSISVFLYLFAISWTGFVGIFVLISNILLLPLIITFLKLIQQALRKSTFLTQKPTSPLLGFLKHLVSIIIITNFVFIGTVSTHELGHLLTSSQSNCEETKIIYELEGLPHTQIDCKNTKDKNIWILGGILLPLIIAAFLFFGGGNFIKEISIQIIGFNMIISYLDLISMGLSRSIATFALLLGVAITIFSLVLLIKSRAG